MPLQFFPNKPHIDFMGKRWVGFGLSILLTLAAFGVLFTKGLNLGIDFTGGILMEIHSDKPVDLGPLRESLNHQGFGEISLQNMGSENDVMVRIQVSKDADQSKTTARVKEIIAADLGNVDYRKIDFVGPTVGEELVQAGIMAVLCSFAAIMTA
jgi:preprotein translocase subunit SecF